MKLQILGTGCAKCNALAQIAQQAARELGQPCELEKVTDLKRIMSFGVMMTPALAVNGEIVVAGRVPNLNELKSMLKPSA